MTQTTASAARKAQLGMTAALGAAVVLGGALALVNSHAAHATSVRPEVLEPRAAVQPQPAAAPVEDTSAALSGAVQETLAVSKYTYLRLSTATGEVWAAVPAATVAVGSQVAIANATRMADFKSSTLNRTFKEIYFGTLSTPSAPTAAGHKFSPADVLDQDEQELPAGHPDIGASGGPGPVNDSDPLPPGHPDLNGAPAIAPGNAPSPHGAPAAAVALAADPIAPARGDNAHVISELNGKLAGHRVRIRGQVTKVTPGIQGHTFFHLRDGNPGGPGPATDLAVTSSLEPQRGQVATFEGVLRANVDIGIGYSYPLLLENATLVAE